MAFIHEKLRAYRFALAFYRVVKMLRAGLPRGLGPIGDQMSRAAQSVVLNLAEGGAQRARDMKRRHYRIALASTGECAAALDLLEIEDAATPELVALARRRLSVTAAITSGLAR